MLLSDTIIQLINCDFSNASKSAIMISSRTLEIHLKTSTYFILSIHIYSFSYSKRFWDTMLTGMDFPFLELLECNIPEFWFWSANSTANASVLCKEDITTASERTPSPVCHWHLKDIFPSKTCLHLKCIKMLKKINPIIFLLLFSIICLKSVYVSVSTKVFFIVPFSTFNRYHVYFWSQTV